MILYTIEKDGCLNGIYTNEHSSVQGEVYNEIARKKTGKGLTGQYACAYLETRNDLQRGSLYISQKAGVLELTWYNDQEQRIFEGFGYQITATCLIVHYKSVQQKADDKASTDW